VPLGFNFSGGLDSSLLLALMHHLYPSDKHIEAFTFYTGDERYDELPWVEEMIRMTFFPLLEIFCRIRSLHDFGSLQLENRTLFCRKLINERPLVF